MHLDTDSLVVPGEHMLHVLNRRGLFHVKGQDVHRLYERLTPFFAASPRVDDLLSRIPQAQRSAVRACLTSLRDLGALHEDSTSSVEVTNSTDNVLFMTPAEAGRWLLRVQEGQWSGRLTCVTIDGDLTVNVDAEEQARRDAYGRWLRRHGREVLPEDDWIRVYALSPSGELRRVAVVSPSGEPGLRALPGQLGIVRCTDVDQVPLVVLTAAHPLFTQAAITHAGLHHTTVRERLLRELIVRLDLAADPDLTAAVDSMCIAPTLMPLQLAVLDRWAGAHLRDDRCDWVECDLLQQAVHLPFIAHLQQIVRVRVRRRQLIAEASETTDGFCTFRLGSRCATSFVRAKALGDLLLAHVWDEFYRDSGVEPVLRSDYADVATDAEQRAALQRAREAASRGPTRPIFRFHTVRRWGITAWVGGVLPPGDAR